MSGRQTAAGVRGRVEADEALLKDSVGLEKKEGTEERGQGGSCRAGPGFGWSKAVSQADGQCRRTQEETPQCVMVLIVTFSFGSVHEEYLSSLGRWTLSG